MGAPRPVGRARRLPALTFRRRFTEVAAPEGLRDGRTRLLNPDERATPFY
jgi:hypothetical protein